MSTVPRGNPRHAGAPGGWEMRAVLWWARLGLPRGWRSLGAVALLVAFGSATVMAAVAGARRGATAVDRLEARTLPATALVLPSRPGFDWEAVRRLPEVEALATVVIGPVQFEGAPLTVVLGGDIVVPGDEGLLARVERPVVLEGRLPDPSRPDEVVVTPAFTRHRAKQVGDTVTIGLLSPEQTDAFFRDNLVPAVAEGPELEATIVGVVRSLLIAEDVGDDEGFAVASPALHARYGANLLGREHRGLVNAYVRLHGGEADLARFQAGLAGVSGSGDIALWNVAHESRRRSRVARFEANSLLAFAGAALLGAGLLVGQAVARTVGSTVRDLRVLQALGMTRAQTATAAAAGPVAAATVGAGLGAVAAVAASGWFPLGNAARAEPEPGMMADFTVLAAGAVGVPALVALGAVGVALVALRGLPSPGGIRRSSITAAGARCGFPLPAVVGMAFAFEPGPRRDPVPVRPALVGAVSGVAGVVAALTFSAAVDDAAARPERFGQVHQLEALVGFDGVDFGPVADMLAAVADDPDVAGVNDTRNAVATSGDAPIDVFTLDPVGDPFEVVVSRGRVPERAGEIALAPRTAAALGVGVGDSLRIGGTRAELELVVSGLAYVPALFHNDYASGAWVTSGTFDALFKAFAVRMGLLRVRSGAEEGAVAARLRAASEGGLDLALPPVPLERDELQQVRALPLLLAGFLAMLGIGAVGHALGAGVRRRRHDLAVLRALGTTGGQNRAIVFVQATVLAVVGLAVGVPTGIALGRTVWRSVADSTPVAHVAPMAWPVVILAVPVAVVVANLLALWPSQRAASLRPGLVLRSE